MFEPKLPCCHCHCQWWSRGTCNEWYSFFWQSLFIGLKLKCIEMKTWEICYVDEQKSMKKTDGKMMTKKSIKKMEKMEKALKKMMEKLVKQKWCKNDEKTVKKAVKKRWKTLKTKLMKKIAEKIVKSNIGKMNCSCQKRWCAFSWNKTAAKTKLWKSWKSWKEFTYRREKKSIRLPKLWHGQLCSERQMQSIVMSIFMKIRAKIHWASV